MAAVVEATELGLDRCRWQVCSMAAVVEATEPGLGRCRWWWFQLGTPA
jgi:hypothetical protein